MEGRSKLQAKHATPAENSPVLQLTGRTPCDYIVVFDGTLRQVGQFLPVTIVDATPHTLFGTVLTTESGPELFELHLGSAN